MKTSTLNFPIDPCRSITPDPGFDQRLADGKSIILLDIETTGLSPELSVIFMIGCAWVENNRLFLIQWLSDTLELQGERDILNTFSQWIRERLSYTPELCLVTYNGQNFDLPFLKTRYTQCDLKNPLDIPTIQISSDIPKIQTVSAASGFQVLDLYRELLPLKVLWPTSNMKLKSMSHWLGYQHSNTPEGHRLIKAYHEYIKTKDSEILNLLFLHNADDLRALHTLLPLYHYLLFFKGAYTVLSADIINESTLQFCLEPKTFLPMPLSYEAFDSRITMTCSEVLLQTQIYPRGLRYYYPDIKNYVYLPEEDYALHKSMTAYIDKSHWQKAQCETCYTWFFPDKTFLSQPERQHEYVQMIFRLFGFLR